jgi:PAS domain S-box-containing protein
MSTKLRALIVEDSEEDTLLLARELDRAAYDLAYKRVETAEDFTDALAAQTWDIIFSDYTMPRFSGTEALNLLNRSGFDIPFIFFSGTIGEATAVEAMRHGARDYILKDNLHRLGPVVEREINEAKARREHRLAEDRLRVSEEMLRNLFELAPDAILVSDRSGFIVKANAKAEEMFGYSRDELVGQPVEILIPEALREAHVHHRATYYGDLRTRTMGMGFWYDLLGRRKDGSTFPVDIGLSSLQIDGQFLVTSIIRDISKRKRAEEALRESEQRYHLLASVSPVGIFHTDAKGNCLYVNERWCEVTGLTPEQAKGEGWASALHPDDRERISDEWHSAARDKLPFRSEYRFKRPDGVTTWVFGQAVSVRDGGEAKGYVGTITDITEAKLAEEALQARYQELQTLQKISREVLNSPDLKALVEGILEKAMFIGAFDLGVIRLVDPQTQQLKPMAIRGYRDPTKVKSHNLDEGDPSFGTRQSEIFAGKEPFIVEQVSSSKGLRTLKREGARSAILVPVRAENAVLGSIQLGSRKPRKFQAAEVRLLEAIGSQMGVAVQKARLYEETQRQFQSLKLLIAGARGLTANLDVETLAKDIVETVANSFGFLLAWIGRAEPDGLVQPLDWVGDVGDYLSSVEIRWDDSPLGQGPSGRAIRARRPVVMDIAQDPAFAPWREAALAKGYRSITAFPLIAGEKPFGVMILYSHEPDFFTQERVELIQSYSYIAAGALENARLFEETKSSRAELERINQRLEKSLKELSGLYTVLTPLSEKETFHTVLNGIIEKLMAATGAEAALIRLRDNSTGKFILAAQRGFPDFYLETTAVTDASSAVVRVFGTNEPIIAPDIASDPRLTGKIQLKVGLRSCAFLPLKERNEIRGIVHLASRQPGYFNEEQKEHLMAIARQMSIALENHELFEKLKTSNIELVGANRIKDEFLSVMSHELRTPLSVITGYAGMMKERMMGEITPMQEEALRKMLSRAADQINMINSIMQTTQLEARAMVVERHPTDLTELLLHLKSDYAVTQEKTGVTLIWDYPAKPAPIVTDSGKVRQILHNLIDNALKFTDRGSVTISMRLVKGKRHGARPAADDSEKSVECRVTDTGVGIAPDKLQLIFDKFYQIDSSETRLYGGVGLGLYIVKNFTALLGGQIEVKSEPGKGSTFIVRIPYEGVAV